MKEELLFYLPADRILNIIYHGFIFYYVSSRQKYTFTKKLSFNDSTCDGLKLAGIYTVFSPYMQYFPYR